MSAGSATEPTPLPHPRAPVGRLSIGEVVALLRTEFSDLTDSKIRFLEDRKLISPARTSGGYRSFGPHDIEVLRWILTRQRDQYLPLSIIGERIDRGEHLADIWGIGVGGAVPSTEVPGAAVSAPAAGGEDDVLGEDPDAGTVAESPAAASSAPVAAAQPPWAVPDEARTYTAAELSAESGLSLAEVMELTDYGLLAPRGGEDSTPPPETGQASLALEPPEPRYGSGALLIARISREFSTYGLGARHLRVIRNAAARDAAMFEQGIQPVIHAGGATADDDTQRSLGRLVSLCERLRALVMGETLHRYWA